MKVASGVILVWAGTAASIPAGWTRETALDGRYPKAWGAQNPNITGGANTHTHTGSHSHTLNSHTHAFSLNTATGSGGFYEGGKTGMGDHSHGSATSSGPTNGSLASQTVTWSSTSCEPPYYEVIFIKPSAVSASMAAGIISHYKGASVPTGFYLCDGANTTPDLRNKYLKGAGTGANAGGTGGGTTHAHTVSHTHTVNSHYHTGTSPGYSGNTIRNNQAVNNTLSSTSHYHTITFAAATDTINSYTNTTAGNTDTVEPAYKKLGLIQCSTPGVVLGMVGLWLGAVGSIPKGWSLCDGTNGTLDLRDKFLKGSATLSENDNTGGSNTHTHSAISHTHTATGTHNHTGTSNAASQPADINSADGSGNNNPILYRAHTHTASITAATATYANANISADTVSNQPAYTTVAYIQVTKILSEGGAFLLNLLS